MKLKDVVELQKGWKKLKSSGNMTKAAMCQLCIPFRDKFGLTDIETLKLARNEISLEELDNFLILKRSKK